jgi:flagellin
MEGVSMVINTNTTAMTSARLLSESSSQLSKSLARLSSGSKLVSPEDDAAGMAVSMRFDSQINRIGAASSNVGNAISFSQTQDGFLQKVGKALDRMSELSVLAQDATKTTSDDALYNAEFTKLQAYISDVANKQFNNVALFGATGLSITTDAESSTTTTLSAVNLGAAQYTAVTASTLAVDTSAHAATALTTIKTAISQLATDRANVGANISTLNSYSAQLGVLKDNLAAANSRMKDVDVATESANYARYNILVQAGTAMLAQANAAPQAALKLLQ